MRVLIPLILLLLITPASAQVFSVVMKPSVLFPKDTANCKLILNLPRPLYVSEIAFYHPPSITVKPDVVSNVGYVQFYELPFVVKAERPGVYMIKAVVMTTNGSLCYVFNVDVEGHMPEIVLDRTTFVLDEVNDVTFTLNSPVTVSNVVVIPLFNANPKVIRVENGVGSFRFEPKKEMPLKFKIEFYNGRNFHEYVQTIRVEYRKSRGVLINATTAYRTVLKGDVLRITVTVSNLRQDYIYSVKVSVGNVSKPIPLLAPGESKTLTFRLCPMKPGIMRIPVRVKYVDGFNNVYFENSSVSVDVLNESTVQISGLTVKPSGAFVDISGDVCNNGRTRVYNVIVRANGKSYYIDYLDPSDFETFELTVPATKVVYLSVSWMNELGIKLEKCRIVRVPRVVNKKKGTGFAPMAIAAITLIAVLIIIGVSLKRRKR